MLGQLESEGQIVVADFEGGLGTLSRVKEHVFDILVIVFEPTAKAIEVVRRALQMTSERGYGRTILVANRVRDDEDRRLLSEAFPDQECVVLPDDEAIRDAAVTGAAPIDAAPHSPAVQRVRELARSFLPG